MSDAKTPQPGDLVTAKRLGWDEQLDAAQEFDLEPYADKEYASDDLEGELEILRPPPDAAIPVTVHLVGGRAADPKTIRAAAPK